MEIYIIKYIIMFGTLFVNKKKTNELEIRKIYGNNFCFSQEFISFIGLKNNFSDEELFFKFVSEAAVQIANNEIYKNKNFECLVVRDDSVVFVNDIELGNNPRNLARNLAYPIFGEKVLSFLKDIYNKDEKTIEMINDYGFRFDADRIGFQSVKSFINPYKKEIYVKFVCFDTKVFIGSKGVNVSAMEKLVNEKLYDIFVDQYDFKVRINVVKFKSFQS